MINTQLANQTFLKLSQQPENRVCFECGAPQPTWASLPNAIFLCLTCAGEHRALGVHVSYVRSLTLDDWTEKQLSMMMLGGNLRLQTYFQQLTFENSSLQFKWRTKGAAYYRAMIKAQVEGLDAPIQPSVEEAAQPDPTIQVIQTPVALNQPAVQQSQEPQQEAAVDKMKKMLVSGFVATQEATKAAMQKVDQKINDPVFQQDVQQFKTSVATKSKEIGEKTTVLAKEGYESVKTNVGYAWSFLKRKIDEVQNKPQQQFVEEIPEQKQTELGINESGI